MYGISNTVNPVDVLEMFETTNPALAVLMCGACNFPAVEHPIYPDNSERYAHTECLRFPEEINSSGYDYFLHDEFGNITILEDYSGNAANIIEMTDGVVIDYGRDELTGRNEFSPVNYRIEDSLETYDNGSNYADAIERWYDKDPNVCTHAAHYWYINPNNGTVVNPTPYGKRRVPDNFTEDYTDDGDRNVYIEATDGFIARKFIDLEITKRYGAKLLNQFIHKRTGKFHVGSLAITIDKTSRLVTATCINPECNIKHSDGNYRAASLSISLDSELTEMQSFIYQVIRHGNNHGPAWLTTRADFYKLHFEDCDLNCGPGITCNHNAPVPQNDPDVSMSDVEFVMEHQRYCSDRNCKCDEWLANELPFLARELQSA